jgi:hypothetical protein
MPETPSAPKKPISTRRKRLPLGRAFRSLKRRLTLYRALAAVAVIALVAVGVFAIAGASDEPEAVPLGTGQAGVDVAAPSPAAPTAPEEPAASPAPAVRGEPVAGGGASYYGDELAGNPTASGERFDPEKLTAAHRTLPLGSRVRVTNTRNGESVVVRVNDRGPFHGNRVIDLSKAAAREIGMLGRGTAPVRIELLPRR